MKTLTYIIGVIVILALIGLIINWKIDSDKSEVYEWATQHNLEVESIDTHMTHFNTPFYYLNKGSYIYEVKMTNGEKWWIRTGLFSNDYEKEK